LICERQTIPPSGMPSSFIQAPRLSERRRPRGAPDQDRTSCSQLDRHTTPNVDHHHRSAPVAMSMLRQAETPVFADRMPEGTARDRHQFRRRHYPHQSVGDLAMEAVREA
jgi:hypothetical protein